MSELKYDWTKEEILKIYYQPLMELLYKAATVHRESHNPNQVQVSTLLSIKTGGCPEDCGYCPQAARYHTDLEGNDLMGVQQVKAQALRAKASGSSRVCMGAAWRNVKDGEEFDQVLEMVRTINLKQPEPRALPGLNPQGGGFPNIRLRWEDYSSAPSAFCMISFDDVSAANISQPCC